MLASLMSMGGASAAGPGENGSAREWAVARADGRTFAGARSQATPHDGGEPKIRFDLGRLAADGLQGPPDGLRALHYEYCIPDREDVIRAVGFTDPTLRIQGGSPGRVGCGADELLCLGHTHQPGYRMVLEQLAELPEVREIREALFE